jgi:hypothetical protein
VAAAAAGAAGADAGAAAEAEAARRHIAAALSQPAALAALVPQNRSQLGRGWDRIPGGGWNRGGGGGGGSVGVGVSAGAGGGGFAQLLHAAALSLGRTPSQAAADSARAFPHSAARTLGQGSGSSGSSGSSLAAHRVWRSTMNTMFVARPAYRTRALIAARARRFLLAHPRFAALPAGGSRGAGAGAGVGHGVTRAAPAAEAEAEADADAGADSGAAGAAVNHQAAGGQVAGQCVAVHVRRGDKLDALADLPPSDPRHRQIAGFSKAFAAYMGEARRLLRVLHLNSGHVAASALAAKTKTQSKGTGNGAGWLDALGSEEGAKAAADEAGGAAKIAPTEAGQRGGGGGGGGGGGRNVVFLLTDANATWVEQQLRHGKGKKGADGKEGEEEEDDYADLDIVYIAGRGQPEARDEAASLADPTHATDDALDLMASLALAGGRCGGVVGNFDSNISNRLVEWICYLRGECPWTTSFGTQRHYANLNGRR